MKNRQEILTKLYNMKQILDEFYDQANTTGNVYDFIFKMGEWKTTLLQAIDDTVKDMEEQEVDETYPKKKGCGCSHNHD